MDDGDARLNFAYLLGPSGRKKTSGEGADVARFLVDKVDTMYDWQNVLLRGAIANVPELKRDSLEETLGDAVGARGGRRDRTLRERSGPRTRPLARRDPLRIPDRLRTGCSVESLSSRTGRRTGDRNTRLRLPDPSAASGSASSSTRLPS